MKKMRLDQIEFMTKWSSTKMAPKGRIPTSSMLGIGFRYVVAGGIWRGIWLVRTGGSTLLARKPSHDPANDRGTEMMNQMRMMTSMVEKGTAPDEPLAQRNRFNRKKTAKTIPGTKSGVRMMFSFHFSP